MSLIQLDEADTSRVSFRCQDALPFGQLFASGVHVLFANGVKRGQLDRFDSITEFVAVDHFQFSRPTTMTIDVEWARGDLLEQSLVPHG